jgi:hypothetical protein
MPRKACWKDSVWVAGADFVPPRDAKLNVQAFQRIYSGGDDTLAVQYGSFGVSAMISGKITPTVEPQLLWIQTFSGGGGLIRPRVNWTPIRNTTVGVGLDIFTGSDDGVFGRYNNRDRVYTEVRYDFEAAEARASRREPPRHRRGRPSRLKRPATTTTLRGVTGPSVSISTASSRCCLGAGRSGDDPVAARLRRRAQSSR